MNSPADTKSRILDVAEELFGEKGLDGVSIRDITDAAGVNLAAVNYHFGSKQELIAAVLERRLEPLNAARIEAIRKVGESAGGKTPRIEDIVEALIRPTLTCCGGAERARSAFDKLVGRCIAEPNPTVEAMFRRQAENVMEQMWPVLRKAVPHLSKTETFWRIKFTFGALHHWLLTRDRFLPPGAESTTVEEQARMLIAFAAAGFKEKCS